MEKPFQLRGGKRSGLGEKSEGPFGFSDSIQVFQSLAVQHMFNRAFFSLNLQMCVFRRKLKPHVPDSFTLNSSQHCFVMIL